MSLNKIKKKKYLPDIVADNPESMMYPTNVGAPNFDLIPIEKEKDHMINMARRNAKQEYDRIMELVSVLKTQAEKIKKRLELTDLIYEAEYQFKIVHGKTYWLVKNTDKNITQLQVLGPNDWSVTPKHLEYISAVRSLGDYSWEVVENE